MAKFKKIVSIIALAAFVMAFLAGCSLFVLNEERYRDQQVAKIGEEVVTLGEVIDYFDTNASAYVQSGIDMQSVWDSLFPVFLQQKVMLNEYKTNFKGSKNTSELAKKYKNGEYLSDDMIKYLRKAVFVSFYDTLDDMTESNLAVDFTFQTAEEEDARTDMIEHEGKWTPAQADYDISDALKEADAQLEKYSEQDFEKINYVFALTDEKAQKAVDKLNKRLVKNDPSDDDVSVADYVKAQSAAVSTTERNIKNNRNMTLDEYFVYYIEQQIASRLASEYFYGKYDGYVDKITEKDFNTRLANLKKQAQESFVKDVSAFASFITNLSDEDFVFDVPDNAKGEYHYVRSVLLPFSDEQSDVLTQAGAEFDKNSSDYANFRLSLAKQIAVKEFVNGEEQDSSADVSTLFEASPSFNGVDLSSVTREQFIEWTYKFNTDPGMLNPVHSYIIAKSSSDMTGSDEKFVKEFVLAARDLANNPDKNSVVVVTDYGIHILFYDGEVVPDDISWSKRFDYGIEGGSASYRFFAAMYEDYKTAFADDEADALFAQYLKDGKISVNNGVLSSYTNTYGISLHDYSQQ